MSPHCPTQATLCLTKPTDQTATDTRQSGHTLTEQIEEGSFYEIDSSKLPPRTPTLLLQSIRVVMVTVKSDQNLTVRYPSISSLEAYFKDPSQNLYPELDEKYIMGLQLASEVLIRRVSSREFTRNSSLKSFWFTHTVVTEPPRLPLANSEPDCDVKSKLGWCMSQLKSSNIMSWGERRLVYYAKNDGQKSSDEHNSSHSTRTIVDVQEGEETVEAASDDDQQDLDIALVDVKTETDCEIDTTIHSTRKRKRKSHVKSKISRKLALEDGKKVKKPRPNSSRWSTKRFDAAKQELYNVMKARGADHTNKISRGELREEARKKVGDTGLLDHLLKHVVRTLSPDGTERFRRRWDSKGTMEYWLESADLDDIREQAGVLDAFWIPPPGWKLGDPVCDHSSDCYSVISALKEELAKLRGDKQVTATQNGDSVSSSLAAIESLSPDMLKERYDEMLKEKARREKELMETTSLLNKMEELMKKQSGGLDG